MDAWTLHWLEASGSLAQFRPELIREFEVAYEAIAQLLPPPRLDILIQRLPGRPFRNSAWWAVLIAARCSA